ncbi:hypothetical protein E1212_00475 [Jiangella ureilytica]|uniref:Uncharacterized protein n=1 Tax=Jiangella ureilytica TaxID=2530374 RepID=A0A4R4S368_9ACTN|nr:hypothetical protein [Jiangella ureilytica]TDC56971.1 hypothetical protein E1212_00475 [Jiangella ureilytica]
MQGGNDGDGVRYAAESLRALHDELPALAEGLDREVRKKIEDTATPLEQAELIKEAHEIRLIGTRMTAAREDAFASVAHVLAGTADEIETLLRSADDGDTPPPVFSIPPPPLPPASVVTTAQQTVVVQQHLPNADAHAAAIHQVGAVCPPGELTTMLNLLNGASAHAVERHGHHLSQEHQVARAQWRLDPAGMDGWRLNADGSADSWRQHGQGPHQVGTIVGHYTSPEAVAKPLLAVLGAAGPTQADLHTFLDRKANGQTIIKIFLRTSDTGITPEDVFTVRAPGTDTEAGEEMWLRARDGSMAGLGPAPAVRAHDMVTRGARPGSLIIFAKRRNESWRLITSYFVDNPRRVAYLEL